MSSNGDYAQPFPLHHRKYNNRNDCRDRPECLSDYRGIYCQQYCLLGKGQIIWGM
jgi:hypothetical protein